MADDDFVHGDGWMSDDSDFFGDSKTQQRWESKAEAVPLAQIIAQYSSHVKFIPSPNVDFLTKPSQPDEGHVLYNPYEGDEAARQLSESVDAFLERLPPSSTSYETIGPWIWIANPVVKGKGKGRSMEDREDLPTLQHRGLKLLKEFESKRAKIEHDMAGKAKPAITRKINPMREKLKKDILELAHETRCTSGKWMLFPPPAELEQTWRLVVEGVADGRLGTAAKVASKESSSSDDKRLICVYTRDFADMDDVRRVLHGLLELELVPNEGRGIYYKCDAYTHLGIESSNEYGLRASLYGSGDILKEADQSRKRKER